MERNNHSSLRLAAKTAAPRLRGVSLRSEQLARVAEDAQRRVLLVRAPAGYGKTSLVAAAAAALGWRCVWYRLDSQDEDPECFLGSLTEAAGCLTSTGREPFGERAEALGEELPATALAAKVAASLGGGQDEQLFYVLDEYDALASTERFDETIATLLPLLPEAVHLVILSRTRPKFATAKLELDGDLGEITYRDLALDREQIARAFEQQSGGSLPPRALERLLELSEGWAAGVVLAARAARGMDAPELERSLDELALERAVFPYLSAEVYEAQPSEVREFLRQTCFLRSMTVALAEAVAMSPDARRLLERLIEEELFTFAGPQGAARYHPLFRRLLERTTVREEEADAYRALKRRCADALVAFGLAPQAVELYLELGELKATLGLLKSGGTGLLDKCGDALLQQWVDALVGDSTADSSWATLIEARRLFRRGHLVPAREQLELASAALSGDADGRYLAERALARHSYLTNHDEQAVDHARQALAAAADRHQVAEGLVTLAQTLSATCRWQELDETLAKFDAILDAPPELTTEIAVLEAQRAYMAGDVRKALAAAESALGLARRHAGREVAASLQNGVAALSLLLGDYESAERHLAQTQKECAAHQLSKAGAEAQLTEAALRAQKGRSDQALLLLDRVAEERYARDNAALQFEVEALRGATLRRAGRPEAAAHAYEQAVRIIASGGPPYDRVGAQLDLAFTLYLRSADRRTATQVQQLMDEAARLQFLFHYAKGRLYLGLMSAGSDDPLAGDLSLPCEELLRLGHLDFLGQELCAHPQALHSLAAAEVDDALLVDILATIACQARGPEVLSSWAHLDERAGILAVEAARRRMPAEGRRRLQSELRRHPSRRVRDRARRTLIAGDSGRLFPELTPREEEILALIAEGAANRQIAEQLSLTVATVKTHVHRILTRIGASGRLGAAVVYKQRAAESCEHPRGDANGEG